MQSKVTVDRSTCNFECRSRPCSRADIGDHIFRSDRHELEHAIINTVVDKFPAQIQMLAVAFEMTRYNQTKCTMIAPNLVSFRCSYLLVNKKVGASEGNQVHLPAFDRRTLLEHKYTLRVIPLLKVKAREMKQAWISN